jgi:hypothetical protein
MLETPVQHAVREITSALDTMPSASAGDSDAERLLRLIDKRFMDLIDLLPARPNTQTQPRTFSVSADVTKHGKRISRISLDVSEGDTIQDVADALYFKIEKHVGPYKYLEQWVVRDNTWGVNLIMRDFLPHVKANAIIRPGHEYEVILLSSWEFAGALICLALREADVRHDRCDAAEAQTHPLAEWCSTHLLCLVRPIFPSLGGGRIQLDK